MSEKCFICKKKTDLVVWYSSGEFEEIYLCRSHYFKWCKNKEKKKVEEKYKGAKPNTNEWHRYCKALQNRFDKWMKEELKSKLQEKEKK